MVLPENARCSGQALQNRTITTASYHGMFPDRGHKEGAMAEFPANGEREPKETS